MKCSLLYSKERNAVKTGTIGARTLYHLSLDSTFAKLCEDDMARNGFLKIVSEPCQTWEEIQYRQDIVKVFSEHPDFLGECKSILDRFWGLYEGFKKEQQSTMRYLRGSSSDVSPKTLYNIVQSNVVTLKRCIAFVRSIAAVFEEYGIDEACPAEGLRRAAGEAQKMIFSKALDELEALCIRIEDIGVDAVWDFAMQIGAGGQIEDCAMMEHRYLHIVDPEAKHSRRFLFFGKNEPVDTGNCVRLHMIKDISYDKIVSAPLQCLAEQIGTVAEGLFAIFCDIAPEMNFYFTAVQYIEHMQAKGVSLVYPREAVGTGIQIHGLRDILLLEETKDADSVIPNDISGMDGRYGMVVFGENNSGKTVFLRSIGVAQLLFQSGLPIPADDAEMTICTQIVSQFSEAEKEFERGNDAGRFEQEVRELAVVIDTLDDGALILLNETFQTTAYEEGALGLYHILEYFMSRHIRFLLVSHLHQLEGQFSPQEVEIRRTYPGFHVLADSMSSLGNLMSK